MFGSSAISDMMLRMRAASESQDQVADMDVSREHIEIVEGAGGPKARIRGHRIRVVDVVGWYEQAGMSADEILEEFPTITKADIYAALAYYWDHKEELDRKMADDEAYVQEMMKKDPGRIQTLLKQRHQERVG